MYVTHKGWQDYVKSTLEILKRHKDFIVYNMVNIFAEKSNLQMSSQTNLSFVNEKLDWMSPFSGSTYIYECESRLDEFILTFHTHLWKRSNQVISWWTIYHWFNVTLRYKFTNKKDTLLTYFRIFEKILLALWILLPGGFPSSVNIVSPNDLGLQYFYSGKVFIMYSLNKCTLIWMQLHTQKVLD